jgi:hypothetical protein
VPGKFVGGLRCPATRRAMPSSSRSAWPPGRRNAGVTFRYGVTISGLTTEAGASPAS